MSSQNYQSVQQRFNTFSSSSSQNDRNFSGDLRTLIHKRLRSIRPHGTNSNSKTSKSVTLSAAVAGLKNMGNQQSNADTSFIDDSSSSSTRRQSYFKNKGGGNVLSNSDNNQAAPEEAKTLTMSEILKSPLGRYHVTVFLEERNSKLLRLVKFRTSVQRLRIENQNENYNETSKIQRHIFETYLSIHGEESVNAIMGLEKDDYNYYIHNIDDNRLDVLEQFSKSALDTLQEKVFQDFCSSAEYQVYLTRMAQIKSSMSEKNSKQPLVESTLKPKVAGYLVESGGNLKGTIEVKKYGGIGKRPRWKLRHAKTMHDCLLVYSDYNEANVLEQHRIGKWQAFSLIHANILDYCDDGPQQREHSFRMDFHIWSQHTNFKPEPKSLFLSTESAESLRQWRNALSERISMSSEEFKNAQVTNNILSYHQLQKSVNKAFCDSLFLMDSQASKIATRSYAREGLSGHLRTTMKASRIDKKSAAKTTKPAPEVRKAPKKSLPFLNYTSTVLGVSVTTIRRTLYIFRALVFLTLSWLLGFNSSGSFPWTVSIGTAWCYSDFLLKHEIVMEHYPSTLLLLLFTNYIGQTYTSYSYMCVILPIAIVKGYKEASNQHWAAVRREISSRLHLSSSLEKTGIVNMEKLEWVNVVLERSWSTLKLTTENTLKYYSMNVLEDNLPSFLSRVDLTKLEFGKAPQITGIYVHDTNGGSSSDTVTFDIEIAWRDTPDIVIQAVTKAAVRVDVALTELDISGTIRVEFFFDGWEDNVPQWPCFSAMRYAFTKKPDIKFRLRTMRLDVMNVPLLSGWLDGLISTLIAKNFTYPNAVTCPDWRTYDSTYPTSTEAPENSLLDALNTQVPLGILAIKVKQCIGIHRAEKFPVLYCELELDGEYRKQMYRTQKNNDTVAFLNPTWEEEFFFLIDDPLSQSVSVKLFNGKALSKDEVLGSATYAVKDLKGGCSIKRNLVLAEKYSGVLELELSWKRIESPSSIPKAVIGSPRHTPGILIVTLLNGVNLGGPTAPKGNPYVSFSLSIKGKSALGIARSDIAKKSINPTWNQSFYFIVNDPKREVLRAQVRCQCVSSNSIMSFNPVPEEVLGELHLETKKFCTAALDTVSQFPLDVPLTGTLRLKLVWRSFIEDC